MRNTLTEMGHLSCNILAAEANLQKLLIVYELKYIELEVVIVKPRK